MVRSIRERGADRLVLSKWALPILFLLGREGRRFSELKSSLEPITPRALSEELKQLVADGYVGRRLVDDFHPTATYELTKTSEPFVGIFERHRSEILPDN